MRIPIVRGHAHRAAIDLHRFGQATNRFGRSAHFFSQGHEIAPLGGQRIAIGQPVEQPETKRLFERMHPASDGGNADPLLPCRRGQAAGLGYRQKQTDVVPIRASAFHFWSCTPS